MIQFNEVFDMNGNELEIGMKVIFKGVEVTIKNFIFQFPPLITFVETPLMALEAEVKIPDVE